MSIISLRDQDSEQHKCIKYSDQIRSTVISFGLFTQWHLHQLIKVNVHYSADLDKFMVYLLHY